MPGRGTAAAIFVRQLHDRYLEKKGKLSLVFVGLEKFSRRCPVQLAMMKPGADEWLVPRGSLISLKVNRVLVEDYEMKVGGPPVINI